MSHAAVGEAVEVLGQRDDIPEVLRRVGVILRASRREGTHEAFAEGGHGPGGSRRQELACSRAPVCTRRCVPAGVGGGDPAEASARILEVTSSPAREEIIEDARAQRPRFDVVVRRGVDPDSPAETTTAP